MPLGACIAFGRAADLFGPGMHGTTFGGNPVSCAAGLAVIRTIAGDGLLDHVKRVAEQIRGGPEALGVNVRGAGLLLGLEVAAAPAVAAALREAGFLV